MSENLEFTRPFRRSRAALATALALVRLGRPVFLGGGFFLYALGAAAAALGGATIDGTLYLLGQLAVTSFQLMTHYCNDYFDFEADKANATPTRWSGGSRVLPSALLPRWAALAAAIALAGVGIVATAALEMTGRVGVLTVPLFGLVLLLSWEYSAPPLRLHSTGLGELDVAIVVTGLVPLAGFYLQAPAGNGLPALLLSIVPLALLQFAMLLAIEFPDAAGDAQVGKRTLVVRLGRPAGERLYVLTTALAYALVPLLVWLGLPPVAGVAMLVPAPVALWRMHRTRAGDCGRPDRYEAVTFWAVALLVLTTVASVAGFVLAAR